jgi:hypothetical protein
MIVLRLLALAAGIAIVVWVVRSAIYTVVVPRAEQVLLTRVVFTAVRQPFELLARRARSATEQERIRARYAPAALMVLPVVWVIGILLGFVPIYWGFDVEPIGEEFVLSGSAVTTLGFSRPNEGPAIAAAVIEAVLGLGMVALLISFLPTIYGHFSRREKYVTKLSSRAGTPPTPAELIVRHHNIGWLEHMDDIWPEWQDWFIEVEESHTSHPSLVHFRSIDDERSWLTASACVLDAAAIRASTLDLPRAPDAELCIRAGYLSLRSIGDYFGIAHDRQPRPDDPISILPSEFRAVHEQLAAAGVPVKPDVEQAWRDFAGWRVNYDRVLLELCAIVQPPPAPWSSDRMAEYRRLPVRQLVRVRGERER